ncbi:Os02g0733200, partial [Oryza sativa Japonica Group]
PCSPTTSTTPLLVLLRKRWRRHASTNTRRPWVHAAPSRTRDAVPRIASAPRGEPATVANSLRSLAGRPAAVRLSATPPVRHSDEAATPPLLACRCASPVAAVSAPTLPLLARINLCSNSRYPSRRYRLASHRPPIPGAREVVACSTAGSSSAPVPPSAFALRFRPSPAVLLP